MLLKIGIILISNPTIDLSIVGSRLKRRLPKSKILARLVLNVLLWRLCRPVALKRHGIKLYKIKSAQPKPRTEKRIALIAATQFPNLVTSMRKEYAFLPRNAYLLQEQNEIMWQN